VSVSDGTETVKQPRRKFTTGATCRPSSASLPNGGRVLYLARDNCHQRGRHRQRWQRDQSRVLPEWNPLFEDTAAPFEVTWSAVPQGNHSLTAVAYDNEGGVTTSTAVNIAVNEPDNIRRLSPLQPTTGSTFEAPATSPSLPMRPTATGAPTLVEFFAGANKLGEVVCPYE